MSRMLLAVPSRLRPHNIARLYDSMATTCRGDTTLVVGVDEDDPKLEEYRDVQKLQGWELEVGPPQRVVPWLNDLAVPRTGEYEFIGHVGDDNVFSTEAWDLHIGSALGRTPFAFGNDLYPGRTPGTLCCHIFMRSDVIKALGYMGPPSIVHMYVDVAWMAWGYGCGITYLHNIIIEHLHYTTGKAPVDESYARSTLGMPADLAAYQAYVGDPNGLNADIRKIAGVSGKPFSAEAVRRFNASLNIPLRAREGWVPGEPLW